MTQNDFTANPMTSETSPNTDWKEQLEPGEHELFERFARNVIVPRQKEVSQKPQTSERGLHMKLHAGLMAEFQVLPDLPEHARFGVFSEPRVFPAVVRFSNGESSDRPDREPQPRGIAIKLVGVPGPKLFEDQKEAVTQDFLATSHSVTSTVRHVRQFIAFIESDIEAGDTKMAVILHSGSQAGRLRDGAYFEGALFRDRLQQGAEPCDRALLQPSTYQVRTVCSEVYSSPSARNDASTEAASDR